MAGTILVSASEGLAISTVEFDYFVERIRIGLVSQNQPVATAVFEPLDEGGLSFISAADLDGSSYQCFSQAVKNAYEMSMREQAFVDHKGRWLELLKIIENDSRSGIGTE